MIGEWKEEDGHTLDFVTATAELRAASWCQYCCTRRGIIRAHSDSAGTLNIIVELSSDKMIASCEARSQ